MTLYTLAPKEEVNHKLKALSSRSVAQFKNIDQGKKELRALLDRMVRK